MSKSKPVDELTLEDFKESPIWEWAIDEEENDEQDETWVRPHRHQAKKKCHPQNNKMNFFVKEILKFDPL